MYNLSGWEVNCLDLWLGGLFPPNRLHGVAILVQTIPSLAAGPTPPATGPSLFARGWTGCGTWATQVLRPRVAALREGDTWRNLFPPKNGQGRSPGLLPSCLKGCPLCSP